MPWLCACIPFAIVCLTIVPWLGLLNYRAMDECLNTVSWMLFECCGVCLKTCCDRDVSELGYTVPAWVRAQILCSNIVLEYGPWILCLNTACENCAWILHVKTVIGYCARDRIRITEYRAVIPCFNIVFEYCVWILCLIAVSWLFAWTLCHGFARMRCHNCAAWILCHDCARIPRFVPMSVCLIPVMIVGCRS
jgi:hypothetical protein